ncbi:DUF4334 domain-containing protein [Rhizobium sp. TRM95796]|uniref:DUF4334 domain-containing protein n=1 Tax=Rhizobium sp. TRM95796 TaxID=2979862 RepID=UPI0021E7D30A|nr:DUF4334 domain-containing protein [Rhizobium sp. TRM95796]MCV3768928.1 DUF4334 domain-containing protein [Rhizobium sp. TRM95796]
MPDQQRRLEEFRKLDAVACRDLIGLWAGRGIAAGHPLDGVLENLSWFGKRFRPDIRADALLFRAGDQRLVAVDPKWIPLHLAMRLQALGRTRMAYNLFSYLQGRLRARGPVAEIGIRTFHGVESAAMIYDRQPITDHFRRIDDRRIMGAMMVAGENLFYFFELERVEGS